MHFNIFISPFIPSPTHPSPSPIHSPTHLLTAKDYAGDHPWIVKFGMENIISQASRLNDQGRYDEAVELYDGLISKKHVMAQLEALQSVSQSEKDAAQGSDDEAFGEAKDDASIGGASMGGSVGGVSISSGGSSLRKQKKVRYDVCGDVPHVCYVLMRNDTCYRRTCLASAHATLTNSTYHITQILHPPFFSFVYRRQ